MDWKLYLQLSIMMGLEFAVWGAWAPVLAARCLGPLRFNGKQTGWIYGTLFLACIFMPLVAGQIADQWLNAEWVMAGAHIVGGVFLLIAARQKKFGGLFGAMLLFSLCYAATLPLINSVTFYHLGNVFTEKNALDAASAKIFIWAPIAWVLVGWALTGWRQVKGTGEGNDCLVFAGILALIMGVFCLFLPATPPTESAGIPIVKLMEMLKEPNFLTFIIVSFVVMANLQFYFLGTAQYLQDIGVKSKNVPAVMAIAQVAQILATLWLITFLLGKFGWGWMLVVGILSWLVLYLMYSLEKPKVLVVASMAFHGIAYVLFVIGGIWYVNWYVENVAKDKSIASSAQALLSAVTIGLGLFVGTQFTGIVMDKFSKEGKFAWRPIYLVPCVFLIAAAIMMLVFFKVQN